MPQMFEKGRFSCFSQSDQAFKQYTINTFMHSIAVCLASSYSERFLMSLVNTKCFESNVL